MSNYNDNFTSIKYRGQTFVQWCKDNNYEYMIDEIDEVYLYNNYGKTKETLNRGFDKNIRFVCKNGHEFFARPVHRTNGQRLICQYCKGSRLDLDKHSVAVEFSNIMNEWDYSKNTVNPNKISTSNPKKVWWVCPKGHSYASSPAHRKEGKGCPYCANLKVLKGYNDLATTHPMLSLSWDFEKNELTPFDVTYGNDNKFWWVCSNGHSWQSSIINRTYNKTGCPYCASKLYTSYAEKAIYFYVSKLFDNVSSRVKVGGFEFDVALLNEKILIEFNGAYWHDNKKDIDIRKQNYALRNGYKFILINSVRTSHDVKLEQYSEFSNITCYAEKVNSKSIDDMVKLVIAEICRLISIRLPDLGFIDSKKDFDIIMSLYEGG